MSFDVAMTDDVNDMATKHLLSFFAQGQIQEELCFGLWSPSRGGSRVTAILDKVLLPEEDERLLHGGASFQPSYLSRAVRSAVMEEKGLAFMHSHPSVGWQDMSCPDVIAERDVIAPPARATGLPLVGLTVGTDGYWSARFWSRAKDATKRHWCAKVRVVGESKYALYFNDAIIPAPRRRNVLRRTFDSWGADAQDKIARLKIGIVGVGSVGCVVAEAVARIGVGNITLVDHDVVEEHNLDRLLYATTKDVGRSKVELAKEFVEAHATAENPVVRAIPLSVHHALAYKAILDCDAIFSCVDRPVARDVLNYVSQAHLIPVVDGGVSIETNHRHDTLSSAHWRAHLSTPRHRCLRCLRQYSTGMVVTELDGSLDDPSYVHNMPGGAIPRNENVFPFSLSAAAMQVNLLIRYMLSESWWPVVHQQDCQFVLSKLDVLNGQCVEHCSFNAMRCSGDRATPPYLVSDGTETSSTRAKDAWARVWDWTKCGFRALGSVFASARR